MATKKAAEVTNKKVKRERSDEGPRGWLFPMMESAYTKLIPRAKAEAEAQAARAPARMLSVAGRNAAGARKAFKSTYQAGRSSDVLTKLPKGHCLWARQRAGFTGWTREWPDGRCSAWTMRRRARWGWPG